MNSILLSLSAKITTFIRLDSFFLQIYFGGEDVACYSPQEDPYLRTNVQLPNPLPQPGLIGQSSEVIWVTGGISIDSSI